MPFCPNCGKEVQIEERFCPLCGYTLKETPSAQVYTPPAKTVQLGINKDKLVAFLLVCLVAGTMVGYVIAAVVVYQPQVAKMQTDLSTLQTNYNTLRSNYDQMSSDYSRLNTDYSYVTSRYRSLSDNVTALYDMLSSYALIPEAFPRTLNDIEIRKTSSAVASATRSSTDLWASIENIYNYVVRNIKYVNDIEMPYIQDYSNISIEGSEYVTGFTTTTIRNYVQTPGLTLNIKQGDCDDQAILAYAMIKYYEKIVYGHEYALYLALIEFSDDTAHLAVMMPVQGGQLCIVDPAGNYLTTSSQGTITSKSALSELRAYSDYWSPSYITYITLYRVDVVDGSYSVAGEGIISQVASVFS